MEEATEVKLKDSGTLHKSAERSYSRDVGRGVCWRAQEPGTGRRTDIGMWASGICLQAKPASPPFHLPTVQNPLARKGTFQAAGNLKLGNVAGVAGDLPHTGFPACKHSGLLKHSVKKPASSYPPTHDIIKCFNFYQIRACKMYLAACISLLPLKENHFSMY